MAKRGAGRDEITVILPPEPPELNPEVARVLLKILLKAYEKKYGHEYLSAEESESCTTLWTIEQAQQGLGVSSMGACPTRSLFIP